MCVKCCTEAVVSVIRPDVTAAVKYVCFEVEMQLFLLVLGNVVV